MAIGSRVRLRADADEGWEEEFGELIELEDNYATVRLEKTSVQDDGLREVTLDQLESA